MFLIEISEFSMNSLKEQICGHVFYQIERTFLLQKRRFFVEAQGTKETEKITLFTSGYKQ